MFIFILINSIVFQLLSFDSQNKVNDQYISICPEIDW